MTPHLSEHLKDKDLEKLRTFSISLSQNKVSLNNRNGIRHKLFFKIQKGKIKVEKELDLHFVKLQDAKFKVFIFIKTCFKKKLKVLKIITGKGIKNKKHSGVIRKNLIYWLNDKRIKHKIKSVFVCNRKNGGLGAYFIITKHFDRKS